MIESESNYEHTQTAPLSGLILLVSLGCGWAAWALSGEPIEAMTPALVAVLCLALSAMFYNLTVTDVGDALHVRFGPLTVFRCRIPYSDIEEAEFDRSSWIDGWGIHWIPGRGTTWNLWGFDCVRMTVKGKTFRIGSDDAEKLAAYIQQRIAAREM